MMEHHQKSGQKINLCRKETRIRTRGPDWRMEKRPEADRHVNLKTGKKSVTRPHIRRNRRGTRGPF